MPALEHCALGYCMCTQEGMRGAQNWKEACSATILITSVSFPVGDFVDFEAFQCKLARFAKE